jgi:hypothetical protein
MLPLPSLSPSLFVLLAFLPQGWVQACKFDFQGSLVVSMGYTWYTTSIEMLTCRFLLDNATTIRHNKKEE